MALFNNPLTRVTWNAARAAAYGWRASLSAYSPTVDYVGSLDFQTSGGSTFASAGSGIVSSSVEVLKTHTTFIYNVLSASYLVFDFGGRDASAELALQTLIQANWQHDLTMQQVMLSVLTSYTSYIGNKALVAGYQQDLKDAEVALKAAQVMKLAGLATMTDVLLAQSNLEQIRTTLLQAQGAEYTSLGEVLIAGSASRYKTMHR